MTAAPKREELNDGAGVASSSFFYIIQRDEGTNRTRKESPCCINSIELHVRSIAADKQSQSLNSRSFHHGVCIAKHYTRIGAISEIM